ncbi:GNAT family N-acetyltransferase [Staphylococcus chromogenes]|uniref:GNAT family N-acetyltransferase n=1 Tax=Staphylococcus chromogenes TaxID=46126 RepID=UPI000D1B1B73|nr:GNAT family N-acetyltransferase [Staphylococcus chromogenes]MDU0451151.1 GNAT family N-acetyltransferase [Staphylococcus chromogenes]PTG09906.1 GNAT family N-acetyltransferase [Staphylococcus chromogenes]
MTVYIETERLILRDWQDSDLLPLQQMNANRQVRRYFTSLLSYQRSQTDFEAMRSSLKKQGIGLFAVELKATHQWIGFIGLNYISKDSQYTFQELPFYEIGWRLMPEVWDNGIAQEGAEAVLNYIKGMNLGPIYAIAAKANKASIRVMEKIGMTFVDYFDKPELSTYHELKENVRYVWKPEENA